ncbi:MAG TPA: hypothetical protein VJY33_05610, partial [Isosphaeraceae bacterium]|nr:hypothetical protein [Isosphaeraceae bacterium]
MRALTIERLEDRTLLSVTVTLNGDVLDIGLSAANDSATVSLNASNDIDVFDGTTHTDFASTLVHGINAQGDDATSQSVTFESVVTLSKSLDVSQVTNTTVNGTYTVGSANLAADGTVTIAAGAILSSRQIAGGDPLTAPSTGDSGDLTFAAPAIAVGDGAELLANADSGFSSGDVTLTGTNSVNLNWVLGLANFATVDASSSVTVGAATIRGDDIAITTAADTTKTVNLTVTPSNPDLGPLQDIIENAILPFQVNAAASTSSANSSITIGSGSQITADDNVTLTADATSSSQITTSATYLGVTFGSSEPTANVTLAGGPSGASVTAGGDFNMQAAANNTLAVTTIVPDGGDSGNVSFAYGLARTNSTADLESGSTVTAANASIGAVNTNSFSTQAIASGFNQSSSTGVGATISIG